MNYKRRKPRRQVRCTLCTDSRYGNAKDARTRAEDLGRLNEREQRQDAAAPNG